MQPRPWAWAPLTADLSVQQRHFRVWLRGYRATRRGQVTPSSRLDQPGDLRGLLFQPQPLDPSRRLPLSQQPHNLSTIHPLTPTESRSANPYQPAIECRNGSTSMLIEQVTQEETHPQPVGPPRAPGGGLRAHRGSD